MIRPISLDRSGQFMLTAIQGLKLFEMPVLSCLKTDFLLYITWFIPTGEEILLRNYWNTA
ncbi:hypothetical protein CR205_19280 [Alteribacter lacisalsi]|uniref:Uncharacterized protein n=1 Tax=Alteribacter lacisalsi TaxID=2045244 RepID=A0A2W0HQ01_9BACI|nr:hypothetical protein CR205_19280 [Alteribacter lacisalsi]